MWGKKEKDDLSQKTQQELMVMLIESQLKTEKHTDRILNNVLFYFYAGLIGFIFYVFSMV